MKKILILLVTVMVFALCVSCSTNNDDVKTPLGDQETSQDGGNGSSSGEISGGSSGEIELPIIKP